MRGFSVLIAFLLISIVLAVPGSGNNNEQENTIKIGFLGPLLLNSGKETLAAAEMAVEEINGKGGVIVGVTTYDLELIAETTSDPVTGLPEASVATTNLAMLQDEEEVTAIIGGVRTEVVVAIQAGLDRPMLGTGSTAPIITPYFWRVSPTNQSRQWAALIDLYAFGIAPTYGVQNVTIIREDRNWAISMRNTIEYYCHVALPYAYGTPQIDFTADIVLPQNANYEAVSSALAPLKETDTQALMTIFSGPAGKYIPKAWALLNLSQLLAGINIQSQDPGFFAETEGACYGEIELEFIAPDMEMTSKTRDFRNAYLARTGKLPTYNSFGGYDSIYVLKNALEAANSLDVPELQSALEITDLIGAAYRIRFTCEPGSQMVANSTGQLVPIPGTPTDIIVHDLYTPTTVGVRGYPYSNPVFTQWQRNGEKKTIWGGVETLAEERIEETVEWPISHEEHEHTKTITPTTPTTVPIITETTTETTTSSVETRTRPGFTSPGFTIFLLFWVLPLTICFAILRRYSKKTE